MKDTDSLAPLVEAFARDLEIACQQFQHDQKGHGRWGVLTALDAFNRLGTALTGDRASELMAPIRSVLHALHDAENGKSLAVYGSVE
ncbi:hypothetical protein JL100_022595 [Skermanella mucosa]|uniref:hypothetical protein n=1 Tax=Skermanella mucosa TaxID=1789672 RepID=UPI00192B7874|nr:hypothetical protein [Skermanella mucosa]UEM19846.1 hypothetical protein JL100_022595 [Skermanella mucosa]